jgi:hypothetical protein
MECPNGCIPPGVHDGVSVVTIDDWPWVVCGDCMEPIIPMSPVMDETVIDAAWLVASIGFYGIIAE